MIGKIIRMNRGRNFDLSRSRNVERVQRLREPVVALTRYIIDADPFRLIGLADDIVSLSDYSLAFANAGVDPGEKVEACGARNLVGEDLALWQAQMLAVASSARRVTSPLLHIILSVPENEEFTAVERDEAIDIVLQTLRLERCPLVWAQHSNTRHPHLHLAIVRVDPVTQSAAGSDWLVEDLHQSLALIEEKQGRRREPNSLYVARESAVFDTETNAMVRDASGRYITDWYKSKGRKRTLLPGELLNLRAELISIANEAQSWSELHQLFAEAGVRYDSVGSGARIGFGSASAKASNVHRSLARGVLEKRYGRFEPDIARIDSAYEAFRCQFDTQLRDLRRARDLACEDLKAWEKALLSALRAGEKARVREAIRLEVAEATKALRSAYKTSIRQCTDQRLSREQWHAAGKPEYQEVQAPIALYAAREDGVEGVTDRPLSLNTRNIEWGTDYLDDEGEPLFADHRAIIIVHQPSNENAVDNALLLAAARWGDVSLHGPAAFIEFASARAAALGVRVIHPDGFHADAVNDQETVPAPGNAAPSGVKVEHEANEREVDRLIHTLEKFETLATRRRCESFENGTVHRHGPLEIFYRTKTAPGEVEKTVFDPHPRIQEFLEEQRRKTLEKFERAIEGAQLERVPGTANELLEQIECEPRLQRAVNAMAADQDFQEMLRLVRERMIERDATRRNKRTPAQGPKSSSFGSRDNAPEENGYSLEQLRKIHEGTGPGGRG